MIQTASIYLHQFAGDGRRYRETTYRDFAQTAKDYQIDQIWFKSHQGGRLSAAWDPSPLAFRSIDQCAECYLACKDLGVEAIFWSVPQGSTWQADANLSIAIGKRSGNVTQVHLEMTKGSWDAPQWGVGGIVPYFQKLKDAGLWVDVSAVMRFHEPETIPYPQLQGLIDLLYSRSFWTDFERPDAANVVLEDIGVMRRLGFGHQMGIVMPHNGTRAQLDAAWQLADRENCRGVAIWAWDWVQSAQPFVFLRDIPRREVPEPPEPPAPPKPPPPPAPPDISEETRAILTLLDHQFRLKDAIVAKGRRDVGDPLHNALVAIKNLLGEP